MFGSLKSIAALIVEAFSIMEKVQAQRDKTSKRNLAQTLHLVYLRLNEAIATGEQMVGVLERFRQDPTQLTFSGVYEIEVDGVLFEDLLVRQSENLKNLDECLRDYSDIIRVIDANLYLRIAQFTAFKGVGVRWLATLLGRRGIPFDSLSIDDVKHLVARSQFMLATSRDDEGVAIEESRVASEESLTPLDPLEDAIKNFLPWYREVGGIARRLDRNSFSLDDLFNNKAEYSGDPIRMEQLDRLHSFLMRNDLRADLIDAKQNASLIKKFIEENFSVVDLILDVGSEQLKKKPIW